MSALYYLYQEDNGRNVRIEEGMDITLGRAFDNTILIDDTSVSRHHAAIRWKKGMLYITDLNSTNGTMVNGEKVEQGLFYELNYADQVTIGNVAFKVLDEQSVITKNFSANRMPAKTMVFDVKSMKKRTLNQDDFNKE